MTTRLNDRQPLFDEWVRAFELWNEAAAQVRTEDARFERIKSEHESLWTKLIEARELAAKTLEKRRTLLDDALPRPDIQTRNAVL